MLALLGTVALVAAGSAAWLGSQRATASSGASSEASAGGSGILRVGTTDYIDSFNPFNYIEGQGLNAMVMVYPLLVQVDYSNKRGLLHHRRLGEVVADVEGRQDLDVQGPPERQVVRRQADDGRRRRVDDQHDDQVRGTGRRPCRRRR